MEKNADIAENTAASTIPRVMRTPDGLPFPAHPLLGVAVLAWWLVRYLWYRIGLAQRPPVRTIYREGLSALRYCFRCHDRLRIRGADHCPSQGPAVFASNHVATFDPFYTLYSIWVGSGCGIKTYSMMRDDFFGRMNTRLMDFDEIMHLVGAFPVSRDQVRVTQLKPFVEVLRQGDAFFMYPSGTRTRSGLFMELPDARQEPGSASFFIAQAARKSAAGTPAAVPMARTINIVTGWNTIAFGPPMTLPAGAHRAGQRAFDEALIARMGNLIELQASHALAALLYLWAIHGHLEQRPLEDLCVLVRKVLAESGHDLIAPYTESTVASEIRGAVRCFQRAGLLKETKAGVVLNAEAILALPAPDLRLWKKHPVRYLVNQTVHLPGFTAAAERVALRGLPQGPERGPIAAGELSG